jgi:DNA-binding CsgD family transcriptional regulator/tetratricopeptide (TPR) repeat protein
MLESVRQFLRARLVDSGEADAARERHFRYFLGLAEQLAPHLALGDGPQCLAGLEADHDNLDTALEWGANADASVEMLRFTAALTLFWELRGHLGKGGRWFARVLSDDDAAPSVERARALWGAAHVALYGDDFTTMLARAPQALAMAETVGDDWAAARALNTLGLGELLFDPESGRVRLARSIELGRVIGDDWAVADGWKMTTISYYVAHDESGAAHSLNELRRVAERLESGFFLAWYHSEVGYFAAHRGDYAAAHAAFDQGAHWARVVGDPSTAGFTEAWSLDARAATGDRAEAAAGLEALIARANPSGSGLAVPEAATSLADIALATGDVVAASTLLEPLIEAIRDDGPPVWVGQLLRTLGAAKRMAGDLDGAQATFEAATSLVAPLGNDWLLALIEYELGLVARDRGEAGDAEDLLHSALGRQVRHDLRPGIAVTLEALGALALDAESRTEAVRCFAAADTLRSAIGLAIRPVDETERAQRVTLARELLGPEAFEQHWTAAATLSLGEMIEYVSRARGERKRPTAGWPSLTPTELRIVALVAAGLTNPKIAERMFVARGTVKVHLSHIFAKLGVSTRAELAAQATKRGAAEG